jgi:hypothetical protein
MLVITSPVRMLHWVHRHTTYLRPAVSLHSELVVSITSLKKGLLSSPSTCYLPDHSSAAAWTNFLSTGWELDPVKMNKQTINKRTLDPVKMNNKRTLPAYVNEIWRTMVSAKPATISASDFKRIKLKT